MMSKNPDDELIFFRQVKLMVKIKTAINEYHEEVKRIRDTGSFEEFWDDFISDL